MPLTNVWCQGDNGEWVRTDAHKEELRNQTLVRAEERKFRCYSCFQYVTFVKGDKYRSHFRHSSTEADKECEDRSKIYGNRTSSSMGQLDAPDPMRLRLDGNRVVLEVGFLPISMDELQEAESANMVITISGNVGRNDKYRVDSSRFTSHAMCWLHLPLAWAYNYSIDIKPADSIPKTWNNQRAPLSQLGDIFDCYTGRRISEKSDVMVGRHYYYLCRIEKHLHPRESIHIEKIEILNDKWNLYEICANTYSDDASEFFFDLGLRLTANPASISIVWPPVAEDDNVINTNQRVLAFRVCGESDFDYYPPNDELLLYNKAISNNERLAIVQNDGSLQMACASRDGQRLQILYVRSLERSCEILSPRVEILDDDRKPVTETKLDKPLKNGALVLKSDVDAVVDVSDQRGFLFRRFLTARTESRISDLSDGMTLTIRQGMDAVKTIVIDTFDKRNTGSSQAIAWDGEMTPFPRRYAGVLKQLNPSSALYAKVYQALQMGKIPRNGLKSLIKLMEARQHYGG